jgi:hypothetical protein
VCAPGRSTTSRKSRPPPRRDIDANRARALASEAVGRVGCVPGDHHPRPVDTRHPGPFREDGAPLVEVSIRTSRSRSSSVAPAGLPARHSARSRRHARTGPDGPTRGCRRRARRPGRSRFPRTRGTTPPCGPGGTACPSAACREHRCRPRSQAARLVDVPRNQPESWRTVRSLVVNWKAGSGPPTTDRTTPRASARGRPGPGTTALEGARAYGVDPVALEVRGDLAHHVEHTSR